MKRTITTFWGTILILATVFSCQSELDLAPAKETSDSQVDKSIIAKLPIPKEINFSKGNNLDGRTFNQDEYAEDFKSFADFGWTTGTKYLGFNQDFPWNFFQSKVYETGEKGENNELHIKNGGWAAMSFFYVHGLENLSFVLSSTEYSTNHLGNKYYYGAEVDVYLFFDNQWNHVASKYGNDDKVTIPVNLDIAGPIAVGLVGTDPNGNDARIDNLVITACQPKYEDTERKDFNRATLYFNHNVNNISQGGGGCPHQFMAHHQHGAWVDNKSYNIYNTFIDGATHSPLGAYFHASSAYLGNAPLLNNPSWHSFCWNWDTGLIVSEDFARAQLMHQSYKTLSDTMVEESFSMFNLVPMNPSLEAGHWTQLRNYIQDQIINHDKEAHIVTLPYGSGGENQFGNTVNEINLGDGILNVPEKFCLVAFILPEGTSDGCRAFDEGEMLGFVVDNATVGGTWDDYIVSVDDVENLTGYDFFTNLYPNWVAEALESQVYTP